MKPIKTGAYTIYRMFNKIVNNYSKFISYNPKGGPVDKRRRRKDRGIVIKMTVKPEGRVNDRKRRGLDMKTFEPITDQFRLLSPMVSKQRLKSRFKR